ncbi:hypothetical protein PENARI_c001G07330 [Penicillium arizonense]|uniref:Uncharacterized protein n=1 Tax=Penicillium arizonense TaxID=1835702 RepID=A0A1F5LZB4_PENAI|nr:hypothetical protein PENARI_c001G07330 [Penicillium arizonense]OGE58474.1 hypothetical protein PENARI_c001G07330 [Penicillium arizonense]
MRPSRVSRHGRSQWPPAPCVEEEISALLREKGGLSEIGEKPGVEGVKQRGAVDQYPIIDYADLPPPLTSPGSVPSVPSLANVSSDESTGPKTPPAQEPVIRNTVRFESDEQQKRAPPSTVSQPRGPPARSQVNQRPTREPRTQQESLPHSRTRESAPSRPEVPVQVVFHPQAQQQPVREINSQRECRPRSHAPEGSYSRHDVPAQVVSYVAPAPSVPDRSRASVPVHDIAYVQPARSSLARSNSARAGPHSRPMPERIRREPNSGYLSDSATMRSRVSPNSQAPVSPTPIVPAEKVTSGPTLAERIEEKLRQREEQRDRVALADPEVNTPAVVFRPPRASLVPRATVSASHSPSRSPQRPETLGTQPGVPLPSRPRATSVTTQSTRSSSESRHPPRLLRAELETTKPASTQAVTVQANSEKALTQFGQRSNPNGLCITSCPRSVPATGHEDWYTLKGLDHLDICPSCMSQIAHSRYSNFFIPSQAKTPSRPTRCSFSSPWIRLAWHQMIKRGHDSLELLYQMTRPPPGTRPCPGRTATEQHWHRIYDPRIKDYLPGFHVCTSCARNIRILMPAHRETLEPDTDVRERICDFQTTSPRFMKFIDLLDDAVERAEANPSRPRPDLHEFLSYARRKTALRDCRLDRQIVTKWHYLPALPELCICEDCFDEVVWPFARHQRPIARSIPPTRRALPGDGTGVKQEASCQLYSMRMRAKFREAVATNDFEMLKSAVLRRVEAERRFRDRREELLKAQSKGYDCEIELRKAVDEWKRWE